MKTICTIALRSVRYTPTARSLPQRKALAPVIYSPQCSRYFSAEAVPNPESTEMAPKFELKTPKGTKDCELL
jgi:hypothetical protein